MAQRINAVVEKVNGTCKFWKEGDELVFIVDPKTRMIGLDMERTKGKAACVAALATIYPYVLTPRTWTNAMTYDYYTCPDPGPDWDGCGCVVFKVDRNPKPETKKQS